MFGEPDNTNVNRMIRGRPPVSEEDERQERSEELSEMDGPQLFGALDDAVRQLTAVLGEVRTRFENAEQQQQQQRQQPKEEAPSGTQR